ncbi:MAG: penicillin-binding protein 1C, partial [Nitrospinota bacterium]
KPFLYGLALEKRLLTPASLIEDRPLDVAVPGGVYRPGNYDNRFRGLVTVRTSLASSLNVPAVRTARLVGIAPFLETLRNLGFQELRDADFYGPALALGSVDVSLWELVNAYRTLANGGMWSPLRLTSSPQKGRERRVFSPAVAFLISDILADRESRSETFGLESPLATRFWSAVKTGTSKDMRDNWCIGYSQHYTVGVWVGNFSGAPMWNVSGMTGAAPVWVTLMQWLHRNRPSSPPAPPDGLIRQEVLFPQLHSRRTEWFLAGTAPATVQQPAPLPIPRIRYPVSGMTFAIDPDIPRDQQRIFFTVQAGNTGLRWVLDEQDLGSATSPFPWSPRPGKHRLSLVDAGNRLVDTVHFTVKGGE